MKMVRRYITVIIFGLSLWNGASYAQPLAISNGLPYLQSTQTSEGYWGGATEASFNAIVDTSDVADTLKYLGETGSSSYNLAVQWLNTTSISNNDYLASKIIALSRGGVNIAAILNDFLASKNTDGGWGADIGFESDIKRTALALLALKSASYTDTTVINNAISYLLSNQNTDGGFGFYAGDESNVYMTALVSSTLQQFQQTTSIATAVNKATTFLLAQQNTDGGFGSSPSTVYESAYAYMALVGVSTDATVLGSAVNYLTTTQSTNGSWNDDPYSTAPKKNT